MTLLTFKPPSQPRTIAPSSLRFLCLSLLGLLSGLALASCGSQNASLEEAQPLNVQLQKVETAAAPSAPSSDAVEATKEALPTTPKLIKKAALTLIVESTDAIVSTVSDLIDQEQGYLIDFQDDKSQTTRGRYTVSMQIRVPQAKLETTLDRLTQLGTVKSQSRTAEDVSEQLVDMEARMRNLRKQEELVLKIMERSGSVGDVLNVAQELSRIRESIERIEAQRKNLQTQVAYSTIYLKLEAPAAAVPELKPPLGWQVRETWDSSTDSLKDVTVSLLKLVIWLLTFSPYFLLIFGGIYGYKQLKKRQQRER